MNTTSELYKSILAGNHSFEVKVNIGSIDYGMDVSGLSLADIRTLRNAPAAQRGLPFRDSYIRGIYNATTWYDSPMWKFDEKVESAGMESKEDESWRDFYYRIIDEKKGHDIVALELAGISDIADYFVIATADNNRLVDAIVDEIENHLNKQLVNVLIDLFQTSDTNPYGATLVFTTHYPEILDRIHRKDNVYFLSRDSQSHRVRAVKYSTKVKRIENKKSEVFLSNYVGGTAPRYSDVQALRDLVRKAVSHAGE